MFECSPGQTWEVRYRFVVPLLPSDFNFERQTVYMWGDVSFDMYREMTGYRYNQIVPQVMIGNCLSSSDNEHVPRWSTEAQWVMQAQYFWHSSSRPYAMCGEKIPVAPGDEVESCISYDGYGMSIRIGSAGRLSFVRAPRPFPDSDHFESWKDFFDSAAERGVGYLVRPSLCLETHYLQIGEVGAVCPFHVLEATVAVGSTAVCGMDPQSWLADYPKAYGGRGCNLPLRLHFGPLDTGRFHRLKQRGGVLCASSEGSSTAWLPEGAPESQTGLGYWQFFPVPGNTWRVVNEARGPSHALSLESDGLDIRWSENTPGQQLILTRDGSEVGFEFQLTCFSQPNLNFRFCCVPKIQNL